MQLLLTTILHGVSCDTCVGHTNEEVCHEGLEAFGGMPLGGHLLPIPFVVFGRGLPVLVNESIDHVEEDYVRVLHLNWLVHFVNCLGEIREEDIGQGQINGNDGSSVFLSWALVAFRLSRLLSDVQVVKSVIASTLGGNRKNL